MAENAQKVTFNTRCRLISTGLFLIFLVIGCSSIYWFVEETKPEVKATSRPKDPNLPPAAHCNKRFIGYYDGTRDLSINHFTNLTHLILNTLARSRYHLDRPDIYLQNWSIFIGMVTKAKKVNPTMKAMFSIYDNSDGYEMLSTHADNSYDRSDLIDSIATVLANYNLDGVELCWFPSNNNQETANQLIFLKELRQKFLERQVPEGREEPYIISLATSPFGKVIEEKLNLTGILEYVDFLNVATGDYFRRWDRPYYMTPPSPLYPGPGVKDNRNVNWTMWLHTCKTKNPLVLNMEVPFFGRIWENVIEYESVHDMWREASDDGDYKLKKTLNWRQLYGDKWNLREAKWDDETKTPYIWNSKKQELLRFENKRSLREKFKYFVENGFGGFIIRRLDGDDDYTSLFNMIAKMDNWCQDPSIKYNCDDQ